jgi:hypothetical protein
MAKARWLSTARALQAVREIAAQTFGREPARIEEQGGGLTNHVFAVEYDGTEYVVRLGPDRAKLDSFLKEQRAATRARRAGVPVPEILRVGNDPFPYLIQVKVARQPATLHPERLPIFARARSIRQADRLHSNPRIRLHVRLVAASALIKFQLAGVSARRAASREALVNIETPAHGVRRQAPDHPGGGGPQAPEAILESWRSAAQKCPAEGEGTHRRDHRWDNCVSNVAPEWEFSIALHDLSIDEKDSFLIGYGVTPRRLCSMAPLVKAGALPCPIVRGARPQFALTPVH